MPVSQLIWLVKSAVTVSGVSRLSKTQDLRVASVQVILEVMATKSGGGEISLRVPFTDTEVGVGGDLAKRDTQTIDIILVPPARPKLHPVRGRMTEKALVDAIATIRDTMAAAATGDDPWELSESTVNISFGVTKTGTISLAAHGERSAGITQTLRLTLKPADRVESTDAE
jgi:hypothetical protein